MLTCQGCMRHCLQTLIGDSLAVSRPASTATRPATLRRTYYASVAKVQKPPRQSNEELAQYGDYGYGYKDRQAAKKELARTEDKRNWIASRGIRPPDKARPRSDSDFVVRKHLEYIKDPLKLADFVRSTLRSGDFETAQEVVRAASKSMQCTVSWNHLIDYQLEQHRMNAAIKTYNEMKKRAQHPDAYTYTIIFRGCANHPDTEHALEKCMAMYQTMLLEKSLVKPSTIHKNALLKMCAKANNVEAMFAIANSYGTQRDARANNLTFTTILNGLRMSILVDSRSDLSPMQKRQNARNARLEARRTWARLTDAWRTGEIWIDEELVAAMGRILLTGDLQDNDDILSLIQQAMNIPRQIAPRTRMPDEVITLQNEEKEELEAGLQTNALEEPPSPEAETEQPVPESIVLFAPVTRVAPKTESKHNTTSLDSYENNNSEAPLIKDNTGYAKPGNNILSVLMSACLALKSKEAATNYWSIFISSHGVTPDPENYHAYLRILRVFRSSTESVSVLLHMKAQDLQYKTFRIAMSTCERDKQNRNAFANAGKILDLMLQSPLKQESAAILISYLQIAISCPAYAPTATGRLQYSDHAQGRQILRALDRLEPFWHKIKSMLLITNPGLENKTQSERDELNSDFALLVRRMIGACDQLMNKNLVTPETKKEISAYRSRLSALSNRKRFATDVKDRPTPIVPKSWKAMDQDPEFRVERKEVRPSARLGGSGTRKLEIPGKERAVIPERAAIPERAFVKSYGERSLDRKLEKPVIPERYVRSYGERSLLRD